MSQNRFQDASDTVRRFCAAGQHRGCALTADHQPTWFPGCAETSHGKSPPRDHVRAALRCGVCDSDRVVTAARDRSGAATWVPCGAPFGVGR